MSDSVQEYSFVKVEYVTMPDDTYRIFDKPEAGKMLVSSSIASATAQSLRANLLLKDDTPPKANFEAAAAEYLSNHGRSGCRVTDSYLLIAPQYEVKYDCTLTSSAARGAACAETKERGRRLMRLHNYRRLLMKADRRAINRSIQSSTCVICFVSN